MSFPDLERRIFAAEVWKFRLPADGESGAEYRAALAEQPLSRWLVALGRGKPLS
jgi:hypothetical protein